jgi:hypothetical protein
MSKLCSNVQKIERFKSAEPWFGTPAPAASDVVRWTFTTRRLHARCQTPPCESYILWCQYKPSRSKIHVRSSAKEPDL